jgi:hypothetical protein
MNKNKQEHMNHYIQCVDELSYLYNSCLDKTKELEDYIQLLQFICNQNNINYPPLEKPINF